MKFSLTSFALVAAFASVTMAQSAKNDLNKCQQGSWALTFDDGPSKYTGKLLDTLKSENVKATFFIVGREIAANVDFVKRAYNEGHQIASHTWEHMDLDKNDKDDIKKTMEKTEDEINKVIGVKPNYMRPPYGKCKSDKCVSVMKKMDYTVATWNVDSRDWDYEKSPADQPLVTKNMLRYQDGKGAEVKAADADGIISLQHDLYSYSVDQVPAIIKAIKAQGFKFVTVSECKSGLPSMYQGKQNSPVPSDGQRLQNAKGGKSSAAGEQLHSYGVTLAMVAATAAGYWRLR